MTDLHYLSATEATKAFRERTLSPVELFDAVVARAESVEPKINAFYETYYDEARDAAKRAEARYARNSSEPPRPLEGITVAVKAEEPVSGHAWTMASLLNKDEKASFTSPWISRLVDAGAIIHARTAMPEYAMSYFCHSKIYGITRNPWNLQFTPGGSSGGAGASVAAGSTTLATGSDVAGSIRVPSSFCGIVGFKPPYSRVPMWPPFNLDPYLHVGPMARTVADTALMQNVAAGSHPADAVSLKPKYVLPDRLGDLRGLKIALSLDFGGSWPVDEDIRRNTLAAAERLRLAGATVEEVDLVIERDDVRRASAIHFVPVMKWILEASAGREDQATPYILHGAKIILERAAGAAGVEKWEIEARIQGNIADVHANYDAILCPTVGTRGFVAGDDYVDHGIEVGGEMLDFYFDAPMTIPFNISSRCPVLNVPTGFASNGVPTGMQIVGRTYEDAVPFHIGAALEAMEPWLTKEKNRPSFRNG